MFAVSVIAAPASAEAASPTLQSGSHGTAVTELQRELKSAGLNVSVDGQYGAGTVAAVRGFQRAANLKLTGVADATTQRRLRQSVGSKVVPGSSGAYGYGSSTHSTHLGDRIPLRTGMSGHDVKILQDFLRRDHVSTSVDGQFGSGTKKSVRRWERTRQRSVDGVVDAGDMATLRDDVQGGADPSAATTPAPPELAPGDRAQVGSDGMAIAPASAPDAVKQIIAAGNVIAKKPYRYGGGHGRWNDTAYDCSGSVSYALHGAALLDTQLTSGEFESWGDAGPGQWVTIYANSGHVYMLVAGLRFDTSGADPSRWQTSTRSTSGYVVRHPTGL
jgi:peptidoglycan hydrolase-like protein with peptidoglycan-binding domain